MGHNNLYKKDLVEKLKPRTRRATNIEAMGIPDLLKTQVLAYTKFLYSKENDVDSLHTTIKNFFPLKNTTKTIVLEYVDYVLTTTKLSIDECILRRMSYDAALKINTRLTIFAKKTKKIIYTETQQIHFCDIPLMTGSGSFIINGTERVVISQLCRAPGAYFNKVENAENKTYTLKLIPAVGAWLEVSIDAEDIMRVRIDKKVKIPLTTLLIAFGISEPMLKTVLTTHVDILVKKKNEKTIFFWKFDKKELLNTSAIFSLRKNKTQIFKKYEIITKNHIKDLAENAIVYLNADDLLGNTIVKNVFCSQNKNLIIPEDTLITNSILDILCKTNVKNITISHNDKKFLRCVLNTMEKDTTITQEQALFKIYKVMKPGEPCTIKIAKKFFQDLLLHKNTYNLTETGRIKLNEKTKIKSFRNALTLEDFIALLSRLLKIKSYHDNKKNTQYFSNDAVLKEEVYLDEIDDIGNKKIKHVGDLVLSQFKLGLLRLKKPTKEKLITADISRLKPKNIISTNTISSLIDDFFCTSQLSQYMDQNNPLSTVTHKRRLSSVGPGGLTRDHANIESRDVHITTYGKICPIETPEGKNIGLVNSLALYVKVNKLGFLETPYKVVHNKKITKKIVYLTATQENKYRIAQADVRKKKNELTDTDVLCRNYGEFIRENVNNINLIDISAQQILSIATALIPFLEHNDANRALMGSNMQRQAIPLLIMEHPLVCTGLEKNVAKDSGSVLNIKENSYIHYTDATKIIVEHLRTNSKQRKQEINTYYLSKYKKSNQNTCINQKPTVYCGTYIGKNTTIADGPGTKHGELTLGKNILIAFIPWYGYNFEDSIVVSEKLVKDDALTTINIDEFTCIVKNTKLGAEKTTCSIPGVTADDIIKLDVTGIIIEGVYVQPGDILVGKVTPTEEKRQTPEERLLCAIFGEHAEKVHNTSLVASAGVYGTVSKVINLKRNCSDNTNTNIINETHDNIINIYRVTLQKALDNFLYYVEIMFKKLKLGYVETTPIEMLRTLYIKNIEKILINSIENTEKKFTTDIEKIKNKIEKNVTLTHGVLQTVTVYITTKRKLKPGDKLSGRHGNKGVVSTILPTEDMPYLPDGTPIDMVLNPLGIPSRMNVGQMLEVQLGWALKTINNTINDKNTTQERAEFLMQKLHKQKENNLSSIQTQTFKSSTQKKIKNLLKITNLPLTGRVRLVNGRTGELTKKKISVGYMYMLKLNHLADDKLHARSTGPYNIITQQPLGGKAHFGGQRFGEMEVWALEAYGAAYTLQEMVTVKADDLTGRTKMFKNIVDGNNKLEPTIPESFKVLLEEIRAIGLTLKLNA